MDEREKICPLPAVLWRVRYLKRRTHVCDEWEKPMALRTSQKEVFIMSKKGKLRWEEWLFSKTILRKNKAHRLAYVAVMTALTVVANMFFEFKLADTQFSLTIVVSALTGILLGALPGFVACFLGDLVGFLYHSAGFAYMPWIGLSMGLTAVLASLFVNGTMGNGKPWFLYVKLAMVCLSVFFIYGAYFP